MTSFLSGICMRNTYIQNYADAMLLRLSLDALWNHVSWPPTVNNALTMAEFGPFHLTGKNAPFVPVFIRTADRALHHAANVWRQLAENLSNTWVLQQLGEDAIMQTSDLTSKYEIEAFLGAIVAITDKHMIKKPEVNRLDRSIALGSELVGKIRDECQDFLALGFSQKWRDVRDSAYHLLPGTPDLGFNTSIRLRNGRYVAELNGVHYIDGAETDLVTRFLEAFRAFVAFVARIRDLLLGFSFAYITIPTNNHYYSAIDKLGNMMVGLGPNGFDSRYFPETAAHFIGPPHCE